MRIAYMARHDAGRNRNEEAIAYALRQLGHEVSCFGIHSLRLQHQNISSDYDLLLFQYANVPIRAELFAAIQIPKVFWCFDRICDSDHTVLGRTRIRMAAMQRIIPHMNISLFSDGDWVDHCQDHNVRRLTQGFDERLKPQSHVEDCDLLFTGIESKNGRARQTFVQEMRQRYAHKFRHETTCYRDVLAQITGRAKIVVCPDGPASDRYYSNRVYVACGLGAFVLHPYCEALTQEYRDNDEIRLYDSRAHLHELILQYLHPSMETERRRIGHNARNRTLREHLYRHRCQEIIHALPWIESHLIG